MKRVLFSFSIRRSFHISQKFAGPIQTIQGPAFAESISEGDIKWLKQKGDFVKTDDLVAEIETDKTSVEVPAPFPGLIIDLLVKDGSKVTAKQDLYKLEKSEALETVEAPPLSEQIQSANDAKIAESILPVIIKSEPKPMTNERPIVDIKVKAEVQQNLQDKSMNDKRTETRVKMNRMRQRIAERLKEAQNVNAMLTTFNEVDLSALMALRKKYQEQFTKKHGVKLGLMSPFVRASVIALQEQPIVNAVIDDQDIVYRNYCDISIAVATPKGLVVPVVRNVEEMSYATIEKTLGELGAKARDGKIAIEDMTGGTFTISNGGVFGSVFGTPIINPPQSAILGMHGIFDRPVAIDGKVEIRPIMYVALTYDHRLIDGREAVTFLRKVKQAIEEPLTILLDL